MVQEGLDPKDEGDLISYMNSFSSDDAFEARHLEVEALDPSNKEDVEMFVHAMAAVHETNEGTDLHDVLLEEIYKTSYSSFHCRDDITQRARSLGRQVLDRLTGWCGKETTEMPTLKEQQEMLTEGQQAMLDLVTEAAFPDVHKAGKLPFEEGEDMTAILTCMLEKYKSTHEWNDFPTMGRNERVPLKDLIDFACENSTWIDPRWWSQQPKQLRTLKDLQEKWTPRWNLEEDRSVSHHEKIMKASDQYPAMEGRSKQSDE